MYETAAGRRAQERLQSQDRDGAEKILTGAIAAHDGTTDALRRLHIDLGGFLTSVAEYRRAADAWLAANALPSDGPEGEKQRLTAGSMAVDALTRCGECETALRSATQNVDEREAFYGAEHPGYAFGLEALGNALLAAGTAAEAFDVYDKAFQVYAACEHDRMLPVLTLRGAAYVMVHGSAESCLPPIDGLDEESLGALATPARHALEPMIGPAATLAVVIDIISAAVDNGLGGTPTWAQLVAHSANLATACDAHPERVEACEMLMDFHLRIHRPDGVALWALELADAARDAGMHGVAQLYRAAVHWADHADDPRLQVAALRAFGKQLAAEGKHWRAARRLKQAVAIARRCMDDELLGLALLGQGQHLQQQEKFNKAVPLLQQAVELLPPGLAQATASMHLLAARSGDCECGGLEGASMTMTFRDGTTQTVSLDS